MKVKVVDWNSHFIAYDADKPEFILERDSWNDYQFYTYYFLHTNLIDESGKYTLVGAVRILKKGQQENQQYLIRKGVISEPLADFCSLGSSLDYYQRISQLSNSYKNEILNFLNDVIQKPKLKTIFMFEEGFTKSLLRDIKPDDDIFDLAPIILTGKYENLPDKLDFNFSFSTSQMEKPMLFDFSSNKYLHFATMQSLPNRISVIIGKNGSGKSTLLSKIGRLVYSSADDRFYIRELATIEPKGLGFARIINISYSAFDSFQVPGVTPIEKKQISEEMDSNKGRYFYCGIRDIKKEVEEELPNLKINEHGKIVIEDILNDRYNFNFLKSLSTLNEEFEYAWSKILESEDKTRLLINSIELLSQESSLHFLKQIDILDIHMSQEESFFNKLSTGHKFVIHSVFKLIYHIERRSLVLFDEPESHLHPPLLAVLMKVLRSIMHLQRSFMIIATHSPVVVQETLQRHVFIIRREGESIKTFKPDSQTYGESIGALTSDIFGLAADYKDYHEELDKIVDAYTGSEENFENHIIQLFDGSISMQAYAYLVSKFKKEN